MKLDEFAPDSNDDDNINGCNPLMYYDIPKLESVARRLVSASVNPGWYDLQIKMILGYMKECYIILPENLDEVFPTAPQIAYYIERNIIKAYPSNEPPYIIPNPNYRPRKPKLKETHHNSDNNYSFIYQALKDFLPLAATELKLTQLPKIKISKSLNYNGQPSFGSYNGSEIELGIDGRHPVDICRTLAHELTHFKQDSANQLNHDSGKTGSKEENQANSVAGIIMRKFSQKFPEYINNESH